MQRIFPGVLLVPLEEMVFSGPVSVPVPGGMRKFQEVDVRRINAEGLSIIKAFEGLRDGNPLTPNYDPYLCPAGVWTIGRGHAITVDGRVLRGERDRRLAMSIYPGGLHPDEVEGLLWADTLERAIQLERLLRHPVNDDQFSACLCLFYNIGYGNFALSGVCRYANAGDLELAGNSFRWWRKINGEVVDGLVRRRAAEKALFRSDKKKAYFLGHTREVIADAYEYLGFDPPDR